MPMPPIDPLKYFLFFVVMEKVQQSTLMMFWVEKSKLCEVASHFLWYDFLLVVWRVYYTYTVEYERNA
jgi:hypothetical protein